MLLLPAHPLIPDKEFGKDYIMTLTLIDYITGNEIPDVGAEGSRQLFEKFLVENRGFAKSDVKVDVPITVTFQGAPYHATVDLVVFCDEKPLMTVRCIAGSLTSFEREALAAARLLYDDRQLPFSVSTNGKDALVREVAPGKPYKKGSGLDAVPTREEGRAYLANYTYPGFPEEKKEREMIIFRSYDMEREHEECSGSAFFQSMGKIAEK